MAPITLEQFKFLPVTTCDYMKSEVNKLFVHQPVEQVVQLIA